MSRFCIKCGKPVPMEANFCPNCGTRIESPAPPPPVSPTPVSLSPPDLSTLSGPCILLRISGGPYNIGTVGRLIAKALKKPLGDVTRAMNATRGILAEQIEADAVRQILPELQKAGLECLAIPLSQVVTFPEVVQWRNGQFSDSGLKCEGITWDGWQLIEAPWADVHLITCAQVLTEKIRVVESEGGLLRRKEKFLTEEVRRHYLDIFLRNPWRHIRMEEGIPEQDETQSPLPTHPLSFLRDVARQVLMVRPPLNVNEGVRLLANAAPPEAFSALTFTSRRDMDLYNIWLIELLHYGFPLPN